MCIFVCGIVFAASVFAELETRIYIDCIIFISSLFMALNAGEDEIELSNK